MSQRFSFILENRRSTYVYNKALPPPIQPTLSPVGQVMWAQMSQANSYDLVQHYFIITI